MTATKRAGDLTPGDTARWTAPNGVVITCEVREARTLRAVGGHLCTYLRGRTTDTAHGDETCDGADIYPDTIVEVLL